MKNQLSTAAMDIVNTLKCGFYKGGPLAPLTWWDYLNETADFWKEADELLAGLSERTHQNRLRAEVYEKRRGRRLP